MKRFFTVILFSLLTAFIVNAQCSIDYTYYPVGVNYGLHPDTLPNGVVGQSYLQDLTFYLPLDTIIGGLFVEFEDFHITSISLPLGLTWECNNSSNACHYDPTVSQYGCVNVSGIPLVAGNYDVDVNLVATHSFSSIAGTENISFSLPFTILPDTSTSSNVGFAMTNPSGCAPITVSFNNNNVGMLSYSWDFGNGNNSVSAQPVDQIYSQPGQYIVQYLAVQTNAAYFLESIEVVSGNCSDNFASGDPDFFYTVSTPSGVLEEVTISNYII
jgi:PKD repeat protein